MFILVGGLGDKVSLAVITGNTWAYDGSFSSFLIQPSVLYNFESVPGLVIGYNAGITADWRAAPGDTWTVPLGAVLGKTFAVGGGYGLDLYIGPYWNVARPKGGADAFLKFGIVLLLPS